MEIEASMTIDATDWGGCDSLERDGLYGCPDLRSRFDEPSAPEVLSESGHQEMNPISWVSLLRETGVESTITRREDTMWMPSKTGTNAPPWVEWDGSGVSITLSAGASTRTVAW